MRQFGRVLVFAGLAWLVATGCREHQSNKAGEAKDATATSMPPLVKGPDGSDATGETQTGETQPASAKEAHPKSKLDKIVDDYVNSGVDGVVDVRTGKDGRITKVVILGAARISTVLGAADGLQTARNEARLRAAGKFRQFVQEKVSMVETAKSERIVTLEGKENSLTETGKKISKNTEEYKTSSEGMVRALQVLGYRMVSLNKKEKMYVMVVGWDHKTSDLAKKLAGGLDRDGAGDDAKDGKDSAGEKRKLKDQNGVTPAAKRFLEED